MAGMETSRFVSTMVNGKMPDLDQRLRTVTLLGLVWSGLSQTVLRKALHKALSMHPNERPANARELREMLIGGAMPMSRRLQAQSLGLNTTQPSPSWGDIFRQNRVLVGAVLALLAVALVVSVI